MAFGIPNIDEIAKGLSDTGETMHQLLAELKITNYLLAKQIARTHTERVADPEDVEKELTEAKQNT